MEIRLGKWESDGNSECGDTSGSTISRLSLRACGLENVLVHEKWIWDRDKWRGRTESGFEFPRGIAGIYPRSLSTSSSRFQVRFWPMLRKTGVLLSQELSQNRIIYLPLFPLCCCYANGFEEATIDKHLSTRQNSAP
jgi:hypothetical protein